MPRVIIAAKRYAQAIFQIASERGELEKWKEDLNRLKGVILRPGVLSLLENPKFSLKEKVSVLKEIVGDVSPMALNLVGLLISRGRAKLIESIAEEYEKLLFKHYGIEVAELTTAISLDSDVEELLEDRVSLLLGKKLKLNYRVDPGILGGVVVRGEDWIFDGSLKGKLEGLRRNLLPKGG